MREISWSRFQNDFKEYLTEYTEMMFSVLLSVENMDKLFEFEGNERHKYPLYFYYMVDEDFLDYYIQTEKRGYIRASLQTLNWMNDSGLLFNDYLLDNIIDQVKDRYSIHTKGFETGGIFIEGDIQSNIYSTQKFFWSFVSQYLR